MHDLRGFSTLVLSLLVLFVVVIIVCCCCLLLLLLFVVVVYCLCIDVYPVLDIIYTEDRMPYIAGIYLIGRYVTSGLVPGQKSIVINKIIVNY